MEGKLRDLNRSRRDIYLLGANERGRFVSPDIKEKYDLELPEYEGIDQIVEVGSSLEKL